jgi:hypothetical protein
MRGTVHIVIRLFWRRSLYRQPCRCLVYRAFLIGDEGINEISNIFTNGKPRGREEDSLLRALSGIDGYSSFDFIDSGTSDSLSDPSLARRGMVVRDASCNPSMMLLADNPVIPYTSIVHDRINIEVSRGCSMG